MVEQLKLAKPTSFRVLPCIGYMHEEHESRIALVFESPGNCVTTEPPSALLNVYNPRKSIPLGQRAGLALTLARTIQNLHLVGWVHKGWNSSNILFFKYNTSTDPSSQPQTPDKNAALDLASPWIFGFETSRHEEDDSALKADYSPANNAYRHPERWGKPQVRFEKLTMYMRW